MCSWCEFYSVEQLGCSGNQVVSWGKSPYGRIDRHDEANSRFSQILRKRVKRDCNVMDSSLHGIQSVFGGGGERTISPLGFIKIPNFSFGWVMTTSQEGFWCLGIVRSNQQINTLTLILLTWRIWWAPNNACKWQMRFNSAFKGLMKVWSLEVFGTIRFGKYS